jgi:hypothetical protein
MSDEPRHYDSSGDAQEAEPMGGSGAGGGVTTLVCELCGKDYSFEDEPVPAGLKCEKCGGTVFRTFQEALGEAADDFRDSTERDLDPDDPEGDTLPGDILDLNRL